MKRYLALTLTLAFVAGISARTIWPLPATPPTDLTLFLGIVTVLESLMFGFGVSFVLFVIQKHQVRKRKFTKLEWLTFISISWILISGYPHDNSHLAHSIDLHGLVPIEIIFHGSLAVAAVIVAIYWAHKVHLDE